MLSKASLLLCLLVPCLAVRGGEDAARRSTPHKKDSDVGDTETQEGRSPVVLVPGLGGSQLWANLTGKKTVPHIWCERTTRHYYNTWLAMVLMLPEVIDCTLDNLRLYYDASSHTTRNTQGVDIQALHFGDPRSVEWLDPSLPHAEEGPVPPSKDSSGTLAFSQAGEFHRRGENSPAFKPLPEGSQARKRMGEGAEERVDPPLSFPFFSELAYYADISKALVEKGYVRGKDLVATPYDFRKAANEMADFFNKTKRLIEDTFAKNNNSRVVVVAHSMGNSMMLYFYNQLVSQQWKDRYVKAHVALSAPWGGAVKALWLMVSGYSLGLVYVNHAVMRTFQRSLPGVAWLLPLPSLWSSAEALVSTPQRNYTAGQYQQLFADLGYPDGYNMWRDSKDLISDLKFPGLEMHLLYGVNVSTPGRLVYSQKDFPDHNPQVVPDDGDGTVNIRSLEAFRKWVGQSQQRGGAAWPVKSLPLPGVNHLGILKDPRAIQYVVQVALQGTVPGGTD